MPTWSPAAGATVERTIDDIFDGVAAWPGNVYELHVEARDVMQQGPHVLRVRKVGSIRACDLRHPHLDDGALVVGTSWVPPATKAAISSAP